MILIDLSCDLTDSLIQEHYNAQLHTFRRYFYFTKMHTH